MTRCFGLLVLILLSAASPDAKPIFESRPYGFDFGYSPKGSTLVQEFVLVATGDEAIELTDIKTGCSCVAVVADSTIPRRLAPGDSLSVRVEWQTRADSGATSRKLLVFARNLVDPLPLELTAVVGTPPTDPPVVVGPTSLTLPHGRSATRPVNQLRLVNKTDQGLAVRLVGATVAELDVTVPDSVPAAATETVSVRPISAFDEMTYERSITLEFTPASGPVYRVTVPVEKGDFSYRPNGSTYK